MDHTKIKPGLEVHDTVRELRGTVTGEVKVSRDVFVVWIIRKDNLMPALCCVGDLELPGKTGMDTLRELLDLG